MASPFKYLMTFEKKQMNDKYCIEKKSMSVRLYLPVEFDLMDIRSSEYFSYSLGKENTQYTKHTFYVGGPENGQIFVKFTSIDN